MILWEQSTHHGTRVPALEMPGRHKASKFNHEAKPWDKVDFLDLRR